jgi:hypothetical protein
MRRSTLLITALALVALLIPAAMASAIPRSFFGVSAVSPTDHDYKKMGKTGFGVSRFELSWRVIQKTRKSGYDWGYVDARMRQTASVGMSPALVVYGTPRFIHKSADGFYPPTGSADDREEWQDFLKAAVKRYGPDGDFWDENPGLDAKPVHQWIIWNEQNAKAFWSPGPDPKDYATLVKISDKAISDVDGKARISLGGMFCCPKDSRSFSATTFLRKFYAVKGIESHFESISVHPYGAGVGTVSKQVKQMRSAARKAGDGGVGVLVGELGWASTGPSKSEEVVGAKGQATRLSKSLTMLAKKRKSWNITGVYVYVWRDFASDSGCLWCPGAGLVDIDGKAKPALRAVRDVIDRFG